MRGMSTSTSNGFAFGFFVRAVQLIGGLLRKLFNFIIHLLCNGVSEKTNRFLIICVGLIFFLLISLKLYSTLTAPFVEIREMANITAIEYFSNNTFHDLKCYPQNIYLYGPLQAWLLSFLPQSVDLIIANRLTSFLFLVLSLFPLLQTLKALGVKLTANSYVLAVCAYYIPFLCHTPITHGTPNYIGLFFSNLALLCCVKRNVVGILLIPVCLICCLLTKQYHLFALSYVGCSFLLLKLSRNRLLQLAYILFVSLCGMFLYFRTEQGYYALQHHLNMRAGKNVFFMINNYMCFSFSVLPLLALFVFSLLRKYLSTEVILTNMPQKVELRVKAQNKAFSASEFPNVVFCFLILSCSVLVMFRMGQHVGAISYMYFSQLLAPSLLIFVFVYAHAAKLGKQAYLIPLLLVACRASILLHKEVKSDFSYHEDAMIVYNDLKDERTTVRGCASISYIQRELGLPIDDNGQMQYLETTYPQGATVGQNAMIRMKAEEYRTQLEEKIKNQDYDIIYTDTASYLQQASFPELSKYYKSSGDFRISRNWSVTRWVKLKHDIGTVPDIQ